MESETDADHLTDMVQLTTARTPAEASVIVALLEDDEIPAMVTGANANSALAGLPTFNSRIWVPRSMEKQALDVLAQMKRRD